jgi:predicted XRE-type DNA-binding protein
MTTVFIAGSISISRLHPKVQERIKNIVASELDVVVGDADGADTSIQECLFKYQARKVTVFCTGGVPRNNVAAWPVHNVVSKAKAGTRAYFTAKDLEMARRSDFGLMVWDCKSTGTLSNVLELLRVAKKSVVFINKESEFLTVSDRMGLENLVSRMSENARAKAEEKIGLSAAISHLGQAQLAFARPKDTPAFASSPTPGLEPAGEISSAEFRRHMDASDEAVTASIQNIELRATLVSALNEYISREQLSPSQAAKVLGVTQMRISDLSRKKVELFGLDALVNMASTAGLRVEMQVREDRPSR